MARREAHRARRRLAVAQEFFKLIPHGVQLGLVPVEVGDDYLVSRLPYGEALVGNPFTGHIHGGVVTTVIDQTSGASVVSTLDPPEVVATLDLRIDHLRAAFPGTAIFAKAQCYKTTRNIAFVRCVAYEEYEDDPFATSMSTFMRSATPGRSMVEGAGEEP